MAQGIPAALINSLKGKTGFEKDAFLETHALSEGITSIRMNPDKRIHHPLADEPIGWCKDGLYLKERPLFTADPLFHAGCYYVQEASSMFVEQALRQHAYLDQTLKVLDLCAAPGGKSTLLSSLINEHSLLLANEIIKTRAPVLCDNLIKWGKANTHVSNNDPKDFARLTHYFDVLVVDAPCSGSGMFRKDPDAIEEWSEENVNLCSQRQQRILADVYPALKQDGLLIYSTCSYSEAENEAISDWLCDTFELESLRVETDPDWGIVETSSPKHQCQGYRFYPNKLKGEGFFLACFRKKDGESSSNLKIRKQEPHKIPAQQMAEIRNWIAEDARLRIRMFQDGFLAIPENQEQDLHLLQENLYLKKSGIKLGKFAGKDFIPEHDLALSPMAAARIQRVELNRDQAIAYLKKEELKLNSGLKGWNLVCFEGFPLGWAKVLPNRINNYYPANWRILNSAIK